jgi:hypothetical protein
MIKFEKVYTVRIVYKSGYVHDFEVTNFEFTGTTYEWAAASDSNRPVEFGGSEIAAVWKLGGYRLRMKRA